MTIETQFSVGEEVHHKDRLGNVEQIRVDVMYVGETPTTQIAYKVNFEGIVETYLESALN